MSENLAALLPPIGVLILFVIVIRALIGADRRERAAQEKITQRIVTPPSENGSGDKS